LLECLDRTAVSCGVSFSSIADNDINIDMIVQNVSAAATGLTDISFTLPKSEGQKATQVLQRIQGEIGFASPLLMTPSASSQLAGAGMRSHPGVTSPHSLPPWLMPALISK
jgi:aspartate kinase